MKKRLVLIAVALMTIASPSVQAQGFLKKLGNAVDKAAKNLDKAVSKSSKSEKNSIKSDDRQSSGEDSGNLNSDNVPEGKRSNMYDATKGDFDRMGERMGAFANFKSTENTKIVNVENLNGIFELGNYSDNRVFVYTGKKMFCLDNQGNVIKKWVKDINETFEILDAFPHFDSGRIILYEEGEGAALNKTAVIYDTNFKVIKKIPNVERYTYFQNGVAMIHVETRKETNKMLSFDDVKEEFRYIDINGNQIFKNLTLQDGMGNLRMVKSIASVHPLCDGLAAYFKPKDKYNYVWGFRDASGKEVIPAKYDQVQDFCNGMAAVATKESGELKWGFVDTKGQLVIEPKYSKVPSRFDKCGLALVTDKQGNHMYINKKGEIVSDKFGDEVSPFNNGLAIKQSRKYTELIDTDFKSVAVLGNLMGMFSRFNNGNGDRNMNFYFDLTVPAGKGGTFTNDEIYLPVENSGYCLLKENGDVEMSGLAGPFVNGIAPVKLAKNMSEWIGVGYINRKGEWIVKFELNEF